VSGRRPGPQPDAPELTLLKGNSGHRPTPAAPPSGKPGSVLIAPKGLGPAGKQAWRLYWEAGRAWLSQADRVALLRACKLADRAALLEKAIDDEGFLVRNARTKRSAVHAGFNHLLGIYKAIATIEQVAGLPATERSRVRAEQNAGDEIDRWQHGTGS
jgi:hypothetical protein